MAFKEVPETKVKLREVKDLYNAGYEVLSELRKEVDAPVVKASLLNQEIIAVYGQNAAKKFYDAENFKRDKAMPTPILKTLQGEGGVQTLDGKEHYKRKSVFMDLMTPDRMEDYRKILEETLTQELDAQTGQFELYHLTKNVLFKAICKWAGVNLGEYSPEEIDELADTQVNMFEGTVNSVSQHIEGLEGRKKAEKWAQELLEEARKNPVPGKENVPLYAFAEATDVDGERLPLNIAAVDFLNIIRPTVAITVWVALMGHALFGPNNVYKELKQNFDHLQDSFIQELRRYYPFFPMVPAISIRDVEIDGYLIPEGSWVVLDLFGTNHDGRSIKDPESFEIDRYVGRTKQISYDEEYEMIAQGGGDFRAMHRCAGEWITLHTLRVFSNQLVNGYDFSIPKQDWEVPMNKFPTFPEDKVLLYKN
ncbi:cytochrome P450 [Tetragenococcus koreensis]|uniref:Cytochrome P450 n=1 Tax=Tetragenococcus koreensis TaxID=290335 RepID=A0AAN4ZPN6_9ENTE|nr:cytochrome P450 [Tetragenococcus koreensis]AYW45036.1 cytochrome P450 [Tetragenococcus koreensis]MCF1616131.1 cytochrome P450 [Tetragenococcus koreensis]MCF1618517.1 cytochrome P450 [Tetragenococcus koreensis]MCF1621196.1 cytochrome P450 [Tetragenococcus koreensis]MCF1627109.1 cytochrome P450 [Tetragenococcus koreensis]